MLFASHSQWKVVKSNNHHGQYSQGEWRDMLIAFYTCTQVITIHEKKEDHSFERKQGAVYWCVIG